MKEVYEVVAQGARYWFLFLMALIVWRSWRWYRKDKRQARKRLKLLPDAGFVGELVVLEGDGTLPGGTVLAVPREGTLGSLRTNDIALPAHGVAKRHLWFRFDEDRGLMVNVYAKHTASVDGVECAGSREPVYMGHGSRLRVGAFELRLRLFAGFECIGYAARTADPEQPQPQPETAGMSEGTAQPDQNAQLEAMQQLLWQQQWMMQQQQQAYEQGYLQAMQQLRQQGEAADAEETDEAATALTDDAAYRRPAGESVPQTSVRDAPETFYPPVMDEENLEEDWDALPDPDEGVTVYDEDMTDAVAPPKSAYVGRDEAEWAKQRVWDRYFGGGMNR